MGDRGFFSILVVLFWLFPLASGLSSETLKISRVSVDRPFFEPLSGETIVIHYNLSHAAEVTVRIFDSRNILMRNLVANEAQRPGDRKATWDGKDETGRFVPPGLYLYTVHGRGDHGDEALFDLTDITGGESLSVQAVEYDSAKAALTYVLPKPGLVNIRYGLKGSGLILGTLIDWVPRPAGLNSESWDGYDAERIIRVGDNPNIEIAVSAYALSSNSIVVRSNKPAARPGFIEDVSWGKAVREKTKQPKKRMYDHWQHARDKCSDPRVVITLPDAKPGKDGLPTISGSTPIRFDVAQEDLELMIGERFEIVIYIDLLFVYEEELGYVPFTWIWDPIGVSPGAHYISVVFRGYEGHFGAATKKVWLQ